MPKVRICVNELQMRFSPWSFWKGLTNVEWIQLKAFVCISTNFFQANKHIVYFKAVRGFVNIQFASWPNVMKTIKYLAENGIFLGKICTIQNTVQYIGKRWDGFGVHLEQNYS